MDFNKKDIQVLDFLVTKVLGRSSPVTIQDLKETSLYNSTENGYGSLIPEFKEDQEFKRLMFILNSYGVCKCSFEEDALYILANPYTLQFEQQGGFKNVYQNLKDKEKREQLEVDLSESNIRANELNEKVAKHNKYTTTINIIIGILNFSALAWQIFQAV